MSIRKSDWLEDPSNNPDNPHEARFLPKPYDGLP